MTDGTSSVTSEGVMASEADPSRSDERQTRGRFSGERAGEAVLLTLVTLFFGYMFKDSMSWPSDAALLPRIAMGIGLPFLLYRWFAVFRARPESVPAGEEPNGQVMDIGFRLSDDSRENRKRFIQVMGLILLLIVGIWLVGAEISVPLGVFIYLYFFARISLIKSALIGIGLLAFVIGLYDEVINAPWPEPVVWRIFG